MVLVNRILKPAVGFSLLSGVSYFYLKRTRSGRVMRTAGLITFDYKWSLWNLNPDSGEYTTALSKAHSRSAQKLYTLCCENKGTYIKLGQLLGALDYILPQEYTEVLKAFHTDAPKSRFSDIVKIVKNDLNVENLEDIFIHFSPEPVGTASLAQVHVANLRSSGEKVAVKVQHPNVREEANFDMAITEWLTRQAAKIFPEFKLVWLAEETKKHLPLELDFLHEGKNAETVAQQLKCFEFVKIPKIHWEHSSHRVLTMEFCEGGQVNDLDYFKDQNIDCNNVSRLLGKMFSEMIFVHGFVHCDPHPGNVLVRKRSPNELWDLSKKKSTFGSIVGLARRIFGLQQHSDVEVVLLDHGLYQMFDENFRYEYAGLWQGLLSGNVEKIKRHATAFGVGDLYPLFATMITVRSWDAISEKGIGRTKFTDEEDTEIRSEVPQYLTGISTILNKVPRPMVMLFKTNDLLRMLDVLHGTRSDSSGFLNMSKCCLRTISKFEGRYDVTAVQKFKRFIRLWCQLLTIDVYEWILWFRSTLNFV